MKFVLKEPNSLIPENLLNKITELYCSENKYVKEFPNLPSLEILFCSKCPGLTHIPNFPVIKEIYCWGCENLTNLSSSFSLEILDSSFCPKLKLFPYYPSLEMLDCIDCVELIQLPYSSSLIELLCSECKKLTLFPNYPSLKFLECSECPGLNVKENYDNTGWDVFKFGDKLKIGCEIHTTEEWKSFSDKEISRMHKTALTFWNRNKSKLLGYNE